MTAYCGFGMSFGGKWFGGYARNGIGTNYALNAKRSVLLKVSVLLKASVLLKVSDYRMIRPRGGAVMYLDPPYAGRTKAHAFDGSFDYDEFWNYARLRAKTNRVLVTEFVAPPDFVPVFSWGDTVVRHYSAKTKGDGTSESIFMHESQVHLVQP